MRRTLPGVPTRGPDPSEGTPLAAERLVASPGPELTLVISSLGSEMLGCMRGPRGPCCSVHAAVTTKSQLCVSGSSDSMDRCWMSPTTNSYGRRSCSLPRQRVSLPGLALAIRLLICCYGKRSMTNAPPMTWTPRRSLTPGILVLRHPTPREALAELAKSAHRIRRRSAPGPYWPQRHGREEPGRHLTHLGSAVRSPTW